MYGKYGRVQLQPITNRQFLRAVKGKRPLNSELSDVPPWWVDTLRNAAPRRLRAYGPRPFLIYSDAAGPGHLGVTLFADGVKHVFPTHLPEWMAGPDGMIEDFEMAGILYGMCIAAELDTERAVII